MPYVINQPICSGCHRCRVECPVGAIRFKNAKYWIDPEKCIGCGHCDARCPFHVKQAQRMKEICAYFGA